MKGIRTLQDRFHPKKWKFFFVIVLVLLDCVVIHIYIYFFAYEHHDSPNLLYASMLWFVSNDNDLEIRDKHLWV
jgi:hypothetical protein